jgi:hypothetical protein
MVRGLATARGSQQELADATRVDLHRTHIALLAQSRSVVVREVIAKRGDVPFGVQAALSNDDVHEVRAAIAANPRAALSVMHHLAADSHHCVLLALAENVNVPREVAEQLANHRRAAVRNAALRRLERRDSPIAPVVVDPDAHIPELRDRVAMAPGPVAETPRWAFGEEIDYPGGTTLSRLAQHLSGDRALAAPRTAALAPSPHLRVALAS